MPTITTSLKSVARRVTRRRAFLALSALAGALLAYLLTGCANGMFYYPDHVDYGSPARFGLKYEDVTFTSRDGTRLHGWFLPARGAARGTVIHFHGNAQNLSAHFAFVEWLPAEGFNVFTFDYRGYGRSEGKPRRRGTIEDGAAAIEYVQTRNDVDPARLLVLGQSLGGAVAVATLGGRRFEGVRAVAIDSAFSSYRGSARDALAHVPVLGWLRWPIVLVAISGGYDPEDAVAKIAPTPLLFVHGTADRVVAYRHSERLYQRASEPRKLLLLEAAGHTQAFSRPGPTRKTLVEFYLDALGDKMQ